MSTRTVLVFLFFYLARCASLPAQSGGNPHRYDLRIERFYETDQRDSFFHYSSEKSRLARDADSLAVWVWAQVDLHNWYSEHGDGGKALKILDAAWERRWREPDNAEEWEPFLYVEQNRGWCLFEAGKVWQAVQAYESAARIYERFRYADFDAVETIYKPLGAHYTRLGDNEKALVVFQKALGIGGDNESMAGLYGNIGITLWNQGAPGLATAQFRQGLDLKNVSVPKKASLLSGLAQATLDVEWLEQGQEWFSAMQAMHYAQQALALLQTASSDPQYLQYRATARRTAGLAALSLGHFDEASKWLNGALADARKVFGGISRDVGKIEVARSGLLREQGRPEASIEAANRALQAVLPGYKPQAPGSNPDPATFYEENVIFEALEAKALAAELFFQKKPDTAWLLLALECHDLAWQAEMRLRHTHQYSSSKLDLQKNARIREEAAIRVVRLLYEKTGQTRFIEKAFAIAERNKATLLLEAVRENLVRRNAGSDARFARIETLRRSLAYFERSLLLEPASDKAPQWRIEADAIGSEIVFLERELAAAWPRMAGSVATTSDLLPRPGDLAADEALVACFVSDNTVDIIVLRNQQAPAWHSIPNDEDLKTLAGRFFAFFDNSAAMLNEPAAYLQTAYALWQKLMPPEARSASRILVVPDGFLNFIPFEALVTEAPGDNATLSNAAYLIHKQTVRYAWSLAVLRQQNNLHAHTEKNMLVIAPGFANGERGLAPLTTGDIEWQSAGRGVNDLRGRQADMQHFVEAAGQYRVLHFSTHAFSDTAPRIELYDQALLLPDIYALPLQADLVVLSACQTGLGFSQKGEGVMSLARAFAQAGTAGIVSSLWSVNNRSTAILLNRFYQNLRVQRFPCAALRQAKLDYIRDPNTGATLQSPYFWAGLVLVGADCETEIGASHWPPALFVAAGGILLLLIAVYRHRSRRKTGP